MKNDNTPRGSVDTAGVDGQPDKCRYCNNNDKLDLTLCERCQTLFCIYCVASGRVGYEMYDVCPGCGKTFEW